jgi:hypothetical protein
MLDGKESFSMIVLPAREADDAAVLALEKSGCLVVSFIR